MKGEGGLLGGWSWGRCPGLLGLVRREEEQGGGCQRGGGGWALFDRGYVPVEGPGRDGIGALGRISGVSSNGRVVLTVELGGRAASGALVTRRPVRGPWVPGGFRGPVVGSVGCRWVPPEVVRVSLYVGAIGQQVSCGRRTSFGWPWVLCVVEWRVTVVGLRSVQWSCRRGVVGQV